MAGFSSYEELMAAVEERRKETLTLEIDLGTKYSPEYEEAKKELATAKAMKAVVGGQGFLGDNIGALEQRVAELKPEPRSIWVQYTKLDLNEWAALIKMSGMTPVDQYERVLSKTFVGVFGQDPVQPEDWDEEANGPWEKPDPLITESLSVSSKGGAKSLLPGGSLHSVVQNFIAWQNSGGDVTIRPTRSGLD
jgi:hypothetical protein